MTPLSRLGLTLLGLALVASGCGGNQNLVHVHSRGGCGNCHTVRGTDARGDVGPDPTHVASRTTLAADTVPNTPSYLDD